MGNESVESDKCVLNGIVVNALKNIIRKNGGKEDGSYDIQNATSKGENYIGVLYRISADVFDETGQQKKFICIVKVPPHYSIRREQFFARPCFLREAFFYEVFLPMINEFQESKNITRYEHRFHEYADYYFANTEEFSETIIMEDLTVHGFKLFDRFKEMDVQHVSHVVRAYAKFHAVSLAIKDQDPQKLEPFQKVVDIFEQQKDNEGLTVFFENLKASAFASLHTEHDARYIEILKNYFEKDTFFTKLLECISSKDCEPYAVMCHGDCWNNNFLFLYERHGHVIDMCIIDWQLLRYASPVLDLIHFIFTCTTKDFRRRHYDEMLDMYYEELANHLERLGSNPKKVFPESIFKHHIKMKGAIGLLFAMIVLPLATLKSEDAPDLEELSDRIEAGQRTDLKGSGFLASANESCFEKRIRDVIIDIIDFGYLSNE